MTILVGCAILKKTDHIGRKRGAYVHENFIALNREKRDRIINAAMREFSAKGFKNASTNEIVKKADISKGALFHYFTSKLELYSFLYRYSIDFLMETVEPHIKNLPVDVFERWIAFAALKIQIAAQYPDMAEFMQSVYKDDAHLSGSMLRSEFERFSVNFQKKIYEDIDLSKFRPDVDTAKAFKIIWWILEGYALAKQREGYDLKKIQKQEYIDSLILDINDYLSMLKKSFYTEEYWS